MKFGLGNKFFEFIQSRLLVAIGPAPEMKKYVNKYNLGIVSDTFNPKDMAYSLNKLSAREIDSYKHSCHDYASHLSASKNDKSFIQIIESLI